MSANYPWNIGDKLNAADVNELHQGLWGAEAYAAAGGSANAFTLSWNAAVTAYVTGMIIAFKANHTITSKATIDVNSIGAIDIKRRFNKDTQAGDIRENQLVVLRYDGTDFVMMSNPGTPEPQNINFTLLYLLQDAGISTNTTFAISATAGYSDATQKTICFAHGYNGNATDGLSFLGKYLAEEYGQSLYTKQLTLNTSGVEGTQMRGAVMIGTDEWTSPSDRIKKNGTDVSFSGTARYGSLAHDPTNNYLLVLYDTQNIARFSGIAGTTLTNISSDITLDTAIETGVGNEYNSILWDDENSEIIAIDASADTIYKFDSSGNSIENVTYSVDDSNIMGICIVNDRVCLILGQELGLVSSEDFYYIHYEIVPTKMVRSS